MLGALQVVVFVVDLDALDVLFLATMVIPDIDTGDLGNGVRIVLIPNTTDVIKGSLVRGLSTH